MTYTACTTSIEKCNALCSSLAILDQRTECALSVSAPFVVLETTYGTSVAFPCTDSRQSVSLTPGALSEPHSMQLYHPYSAQGRPRRRQSSCCGCGWSASSARWRRKWLSFCLPAPPGSRNGLMLLKYIKKCVGRYRLSNQTFNPLLHPHCGLKN